jgi:hypothetical protein
LDNGYFPQKIKGKLSSCSLSVFVNLQISADKQIDFSDSHLLADIKKGIFMESEKRILTGREKDEEAIRLLEKLKEQLRSSDASNRRRAAFNLSWMQEDGLEILKDALFGSDHITAKNAAAYGLRKMQGRMKKMALEVLSQGLKHRDSSTRQVSRSAVQLLRQKASGGSAPKKPAAKRTRIREISHERPRVGIDSRRGIGMRRPRR